MRAAISFTPSRLSPCTGRVGLAGGEAEDFFQNSGRFGYFAYQLQGDFTGEDAFTYTVWTNTSGLVFRNQVMIEVKLAAPIVLSKSL